MNETTTREAQIEAYSKRLQEAARRSQAAREAGDFATSEAEQDAAWDAYAAMMRAYRGYRGV